MVTVSNNKTKPNKTYYASAITLRSGTLRVIEYRLGHVWGVVVFDI